MISINFQNYFYEKEYNLNVLNKNEFEEILRGYLESFTDLAEDNIWQSNIKLDLFKIGYQVEFISTELLLFAENADNYFAFRYQSID